MRRQTSVFGASVARMPADQVRRLARLAGKQGGDFSQPVSEARRTHALLGPQAFRHVFSVRKRHTAHLTLLEAEAFVLLLRWILRFRSRHASKVVILLDSTVWRGAASKGRSSTILNRLLRRAAALEMASDLTVQLILVPSAENPSDASTL